VPALVRGGLAVACASCGQRARLHGCAHRVGLGFVALGVLALAQVVPPVVRLARSGGLAVATHGNVLLVGRFSLLVGVVLTLAMYIMSPAAALYPWTNSRYLLGTMIGLPAVLWPLWPGRAKNAGDAGQMAGACGTGCQHRRGARCWHGKHSDATGPAGGSRDEPAEYAHRGVAGTARYPHLYKLLDVRRPDLPQQ